MCKAGRSETNRAGSKHTLKCRMKMSSPALNNFNLVWDKAEHVLVFLSHVAVIFTWRVLPILAASPIYSLCVRMLQHCISLLFYSGSAKDEWCFDAAFDFWLLCFFFFCFFLFGSRKISCYQNGTNWKRSIKNMSLKKVSNLLPVTISSLKRIFFLGNYVFYFLFRIKKRRM